MGEQVISEAKKLLKILRQKAPDTADKLLLISDSNSIDISTEEEVKRLAETDSEVQDAREDDQRVVARTFNQRRLVICQGSV